MPLFSLSAIALLRTEATFDFCALTPAALTLPLRPATGTADAVTGAFVTGEDTGAAAAAHTSSSAGAGAVELDCAAAEGSSCSCTGAGAGSCGTGASVLDRCAGSLRTEGVPLRFSCSNHALDAKSASTPSRSGAVAEALSGSKMSSSHPPLLAAASCCGSGSG